MPSWLDEWTDPSVIITITLLAFSALAFFINAKIDKVLHEMFPNSGKSMRDAINRIEAKQDEHLQWHLNNKG